MAETVGVHISLETESVRITAPNFFLFPLEDLKSVTHVLWHGSSSLRPETVVVHTDISDRKHEFSKYTRATKEGLL